MAQIPDKIIETIKSYAKDLAKEIDIKAIVIFGSYAKGLFSNDSDIDLAVFSDSFSKWDPIESTAYLLNKTMRYDLDIQPISFLGEEFINYKENPFIYQIVCNGYKLNDWK